MFFFFFFFKLNGSLSFFLQEQRRGGKGEEKEQPVADADAQVFYLSISFIFRLLSPLQLHLTYIPKQQSELNKENEELKAQLKIMEEEKAVLQVFLSLFFFLFFWLLQTSFPIPQSLI